MLIGLEKKSKLTVEDSPNSRAQAPPLLLARGPSALWLKVLQHSQ